MTETARRKPLSDQATADYDEAIALARGCLECKFVSPEKELDVNVNESDEKQDRVSVLDTRTLGEQCVRSMRVLGELRRLAEVARYCGAEVPSELSALSKRRPGAAVGWWKCPGCGTRTRGRAVPKHKAVCGGVQPAEAGGVA